MTDPIYVDNNATTQPLPEVVEAVHASLGGGFANPSSAHQAGQAVRYTVECARQEIACLISADPREIIFTSGGTESINLALRGALNSAPEKRHIVTTTVEHSSCVDVCDALEEAGYCVERVGVDRNGLMDPAAWQRALSEDTALATFQHVNNETGVLFDVAGMAQAASDCGALVHIDAVQSVGKLPINVTSWPVHMLSLSAHKFHGPKGAGALYVKRRTRLAPLIRGGHQERGLRGGTENVPGIVGMGVAARVAATCLQATQQRVGALRGRLERGILRAVPMAKVNGSTSHRIYNTSNIAFEGLEAEAILILLSEAGIYASAGAACSSGSLEPSHVLQAMGLPEELAHGAIRFSLSQQNTEQEIDHIIDVMPALINKLSSLRR
ncbi:MAG: cysteine desulfurase family protein [Phycisphaerae bacterium]